MLGSSRSYLLGVHIVSTWRAPFLHWARRTPTGNRPMSKGKYRQELPFHTSHYLRQKSEKKKAVGVSVRFHRCTTEKGVLKLPEVWYYQSLTPNVGCAKPFSGRGGRCTCRVPFSLARAPATTPVTRNRKAEKQKSKRLHHRVLPGRRDQDSLFFLFSSGRSTSRTVVWKGGKNLKLPCGPENTLATVHTANASATSIWGWPGIRCCCNSCITFSIFCQLNYLICSLDFKSVF